MRGTVENMIIQYNNNRTLLESANRFSRLRQNYIDRLQWHIQKLEVKEVTPEMLAKIQREIRQEIKQENRNQIIKTTVLSILAIAVLAALIVWLVTWIRS